MIISIIVITSKHLMLGPINSEIQTLDQFHLEK